VWVYSKYAWIDGMDRQRLWWFSVVLACELLEVSRSGFYDWRRRQDEPASDYELEQQVLPAEIVVAHRASHGRYGSPRIHADLVEAGWQIGCRRQPSPRGATGST
jgi:putative transposase